MLIDWFTVVAQIINFLTLVIILKYFLYDRVLRVMDAREEKIRSRLESAEKKEAESEKEAEAYRRKNQEIEERRKEMLDKAKEEADEQRKELTRQARQAVDHLRSKWQEAIQQEKTSFLRELRQLAGHQIYVVCRTALKDLADSDLEKRIMRVFLERIADMEKGEKRKMATAMQEDGNHATIRSVFDISSKDRQKIREALHEHILADADIRYETDPKVIVGLELKSGGQKIAWSVSDYLKNLEQKASSAIEKAAAEEGSETSERKDHLKRTAENQGSEQKKNSHSK